MIKRLVAAAVLVLMLLACNHRLSADYFPLKAGARRTMKVFTRMIAGNDTTDTTEIRVVEKVIGEKDVPGIGKCWVMESPRDSGRPLYSFFRKHDDGVIQLMPVKADKPPVEVLYLALPLAKGLKWYDTKAQRELMEVVSVETVAVPAGTYPDCYVVSVKSTRTEWTMRQWLAPGVGAVKWENNAAWATKDGIRHEMLKRAELVSYQVPQQSGE